MTHPNSGWNDADGNWHSFTKGGNVSNRKILQNKLRLLEVELSNQSIDLYKTQKAASDLAQSVEFTREQIVMVQSQLARCSDE